MFVLVRNLVVTSLLAFSSLTAAYADTAPQSVFEFVSAPGDYIGLGQTLVLEPANAQFSEALSPYDNSISVTLNNVGQGSPGAPYIFWTASFAAPGGAPLQVGTYTNTLRYPFQGAAAGLSIYGDGRGCDQDFGSFNVLEVSVDPTTGNVSKLAVDYVQYCESVSAPPLTGSIRINSSVPLPELIAPIITLPSALNNRRCYEATSSSGTLVTASASSAGSGTMSYSWTSSSGRTGSGPQFSFPVPLNQSVTISLTATDTSSGNSATVSSKACSSDTTAPTVTIQAPLSGASYQSLPALQVQVSDAVDRDIKTIDVIVGESATYKLGKNQQVRTQITPRMSIGDMISTEITVTATDASGNTGRTSVNILLQKNSF